MSVLSQLPKWSAVSQSTLDLATLLIDVCHPKVVMSSQVTSSTDSKKDNGPYTSPGVHSYVNRVHNKAAVKAGVFERNKYHSIRRGGA